MSASLNRQCRQSGCGGPASGQCLEHFSFDECPNLIDLEDLQLPSQVAAESDVDVGEESVVDLALELVQISAGPALSLHDADSFLRRRGAVVVSFLAGPEAGKTTLMATMYELARRRALATLRFAGSDTIRGFEERCHLSRHSSGGDQPDTQRTRGGPPQFLHLRLAGASRPFDLLLADRAGEFVDRILDDPASVMAMAEVARADHLLLIVDGSQLFHRAPQANSTAKRVFQALKQNNLLGARHLHIVVTKRDLFCGEDLALLERRARNLADFVSEAHPLTTLHVTGARRRLGAGGLGEGIERLLVALAPRAVEPVFAPVPPLPSTHHFDAFSRLNEASGVLE